MDCFAIIPSAGVGKRMNSSLPKQYIKINDKEIIIHTLEKFVRCDFIKSIFIPVAKEYLEFTFDLIKSYNFNKEINLVIGGAERQHSVYNALKQIPAKNQDLICIHDAARPFISLDEINNSIEFAIKKKFVIVAKKARDTIKTGVRFVTETLDRNKIWIVQTPQIFRYKELIYAYEKAFEDKFLATDDSGLIERIGKKVYFYDVQCENRKITTPADLELAKLLLNTR